MPSLKDYRMILEAAEDKIAKYVGTRCAIACSSGRNAIRFSLLALGIGRCDEVVVPDFACEIVPITAMCTGASPIFCDIDRETCALSPTSLPNVLGSNTKAVIFIHLYGYPVDPAAIIEETERRGVFFIDDAAQALGASINSKKAGSFGEIGILSFKKFLNVNLGGAVTTNDEELAGKIKLIRTKYEQKSFFTYLGYGLMKKCGLKSRTLMKKIFFADNKLRRKLDNLSAKQHFQLIDYRARQNFDLEKHWNSGEPSSTLAYHLMTYGGSCWHRRRMEEMELILLKSELENIENNMQRRRDLAKIYDENLKGNGYDKISVSNNSDPSYFRYPIVFHDRNRLVMAVNALNAAGFDIGYGYKPLHTSPLFNSKINDSPFEDSIYISQRILELPIMFNMDYNMVKRITSVLNSFLC